MTSAGTAIDVETDAGIKRLELLERTGAGVTFRAAMGAPEDVRMTRIDVDGSPIDAVTLRVGNPQCVVLGGVTDERLQALAAASLAVHPHFPAGTNVELAAVEAPDRVRILIWERGVGPTEASGTGACAAAVAAIAFGGAAREVDVVSPGRHATCRVARRWAVSDRAGRRSSRSATGRGGDRRVRKAHEAVGSVEVYSPAEELFNRRRRTAGLFLGPALLIALILAPAADRPRRHIGSPPSSR